RELAARRGMPDGEVVGMIEDLHHVVAGPVEQPLERELERQRSGSSEAGSHHLQRHRDSPPLFFPARRGGAMAGERAATKSRSASPVPIHPSSGAVASVVARAMRTSIAKRVGEMTPRSSPTLSTMSSTRPRVFMSTPSAED